MAAGAAASPPAAAAAVVAAVVAASGRRISRNVKLWKFKGLTRSRRCGGRVGRRGAVVVGGAQRRDVEDEDGKSDDGKLRHSHEYLSG